MKCASMVGVIIMVIGYVAAVLVAELNAVLLGPDAKPKSLAGGNFNLGFEAPDGHTCQVRFPGLSRHVSATED
eukprot:gene14945-15084_t